MTKLCASPRSSRARPKNKPQDHPGELGKVLPLEQMMSQAVDETKDSPSRLHLPPPIVVAEDAHALDLDPSKTPVENSVASNPTRILDTTTGGGGVAYLPSSNNSPHQSEGSACATLHLKLKANAIEPELSPEIKSVPRLRFAGFTEPWQQASLGGLSSRLSDGLHKLPITSTDSQGVPILSAKDIDDLGNLLFDDVKHFAPRQCFQNELKRNGGIEVGDVLLTIVGSIGRVAIVQTKREFMLQRSVAIIKPLKSLNTFFLSAAIKQPALQTWLQGTAAGSSQKGIYLNNISNMLIAMPTLAEQGHVGALFQELDRNLSLNRAQLDKLEQLKQALLEQMFPRSGEDVPRLRFAGFTEPWQLYQIRELAQVVGGGTPSTAIQAYWNGSINWFTPAEIGDQVWVSHSQRTITTLALERSSAQLLPAGTVLFTSRAGIGKTAILTVPSTTNQGFQSIVPYSERLNSYFLFSCSNQLKVYGESIGAGSTFKEVSGKQMEAMPLLVPSLAEQERIGAFFETLDERLALQRAKVNKLEQLKRALLEQMFV